MFLISFCHISSIVARGSTVEEGGCHVHPNLGSWLRFSAEANQDFQPFGVGELVAESSAKDKTLTSSSTCYQIAFAFISDVS